MPGYAAGMFIESSASHPSRLVVEGIIEGLDPAQVTHAFTDPSILTRWWPQEATVSDSAYVFSWPSMNLTLSGRFTDVEPGRLVAFTWNWEHEPDTPERTVTVVAESRDTGTHVTVTHGDYDVGDSDERQGHLEGWQHFLSRLAAMDPDGT